MTDRQKEREDKLQLLKEGKLTAKQKADFYYKMAKIIERDMDRLKELSTLLGATPDSYLKEIDFEEASAFAMKLAEVLVDKAKPVHISQELTDGSLHADRYYTVKLGDSLPGLKNASINLGITYKPTGKDLRFNRRIYDHKVHITPVIIDHGDYSFREFTKEILPSIKAKDPNLKITNRGIIGYKPPEEFDLTEKPKPVDPKLLDAIEELAKKIGTGLPQNITAIPDYPKVEDENVELFFKGAGEGDFSELSSKLIADARERKKKQQEPEVKKNPNSPP